MKNSRCAGRSRCRIEATVSTFNEDACPRVHKYLEVHFNCTKPRSSLFNTSVQQQQQHLVNHTNHNNNINIDSGKCFRTDFSNRFFFLSFLFSLYYSCAL